MAIGMKYPILSGKNQAYIFIDRMAVAEAQQAQYLSITSEEQYAEMIVEPLLSNGIEYKKDTNIYAFPTFLSRAYLTMNNDNQVETTKYQGVNEVLSPEETQKQQLFIALSSKDYSFAEAVKFNTNLSTMQALLLNQLSDDEMKDIVSGKLQMCLNTQAYGMWTMNARDLGKKYQMVGDNANEFMPNPESSRIMYEVPEIKGYAGISMPCTWGSFNVASGGHVAIANEDFAQLQAKFKAKEALLKSEGDKILSTVDIYGIEPGFVAKNYSLVPKN